MNKEHERLKFSIERYDHFFDSINNKINVYLGLSTFIVGVLISTYSSLLEKVQYSLGTHILIITILALGLSNIIILLATSTPHLSRQTGSLLFFYDVAAVAESQFSHLSENETDQEAIDDMRTQVHMLATGLAKKFRMLQIAGVIMMIQFFLFIPLVILLINYLK